MAKLDLGSYLSRLTTNADVLNVFEMRNNPLDRKHFVRLTYHMLDKAVTQPLEYIERLTICRVAPKAFISRRDPNKSLLIIYNPSRYTRLLLLAAAPP